MAKTMTAACLKHLCAQQRTVRIKVHLYARDHSCTQTKFHVDPCRDSQDYPVTKNADGRTTDRWIDGFSALFSRLGYCTCQYLELNIQTLQLHTVFQVGSYISPVQEGK